MDNSSGKEIVSMIKDAEIEDMLEKTAEFKDCRDKNKFEPNTPDNQKNSKIQAAEDCFRKKLTNGKDLKQLEELSRKLELQQYGLIKSKNTGDIQKYLNNKMYKSMTGIDPDERDKQKLQEDLKFGKRINIDHGVFISMYKTQLVKNALFEVSRFCFQNLRQKNLKGGGSQSFGEYWKNYTPNSLNVKQLIDDGKPVFGTITKSDDKTKIYEDIFKSIQGDKNNTLTPELLSKFFLECGSVIIPLCKEFEIKQLGTTISNVDTTNSSPGASACIAKNRIQEYRKAAAAAEKIENQLKDLYESDKEKSISLLINGLNGQPIKFYNGKDPGQETIDDLTNYTASDFIDGGMNPTDDLDTKFQRCSEKPELSQCEGIISEAESFDKSKHDVETELTLKREVEMARVRELVKKGKDDLKKYLEENGFGEILRRYREGTLQDKDIEREIGQSFEAKKIALLEQMNAKMGKRQVAKNSTIDKKDVEEIKKDTKEERARMGQVVMFNNIITSHLEITKNKQNIGTNVNVWKKEERALENAQVNSSLFQNLKDTNANLKSANSENSTLEIGILDSLLGN